MPLSDILSALWSERLFLVSLATLLAVGYLNIQALQYKKRKEEPPSITLEDAYREDNGYRIFVRLKNIGPGDCEKLAIVGHTFTMGHGNPEFRWERPKIGYNIESGETCTFHLRGLELFDEIDFEEDVLTLFCVADQRPGRIFILPDHYSEEMWPVEYEGLFEYDDSQWANL